jgi:virginiamycin B lyase
VIPAGIAAGADGHVWFPLRTGTTAAIGEAARTGGITVHRLPEPVAQIYRIAAGPDHAVWFTMTVGGTLQRTVDTTPDLAGGYGAVGRMDADGRVTEYRFPAGGGTPREIAAQFDGTLWVTSVGPAPGADGLWRLSRNGRFFAVHLSEPVSHVLPAFDGVWFTTDVIGPGYRAETGIGEIGPDGGSMRTVPVPDALQGPSYGIVVGPDHEPWVLIGPHLLRITPSGGIAHVADLPCGGEPTVAEGDVWCPTSAFLYQVAPDGTVVTHPAQLPGTSYVLGSSLALGMVVGSATATDGTVWFTDPVNGHVFHYTRSTATTSGR